MINDDIVLLYGSTKLPAYDCKVILKIKMVKSIRLKYLDSFVYLIITFGNIRRVLNDG